MAPTAYMMPNDYGEEPISRTYQYRKVMKPMLERKRRARINRCLDELKELMVTALQAEGENVSKLEKADILELTVRHLNSLKRQRQLVLGPEQGYADRFRAGFTHCAQEVSQFLAAPEDAVEAASAAKLLQHLGACLRRLDQPAVAQRPPQQTPQQTPPSSPDTVVNHNHHHHHHHLPVDNSSAPVWRPW